MEDAVIRCRQQAARPACAIQDIPVFRADFLDGQCLEHFLRDRLWSVVDSQLPSQLLAHESMFVEVPELFARYGPIAVILTEGLQNNFSRFISTCRVPDAGSIRPIEVPGELFTGSSKKVLGANARCATGDYSLVFKCPCCKKPYG